MLHLILIIKLLHCYNAALSIDLLFEKRYPPLRRCNIVTSIFSLHFALWILELWSESMLHLKCNMVLGIKICYKWFCVG